jgi:hypothetical protein
MIKNINEEIKKLLAIKEELENINKMKAEHDNVEVVSQRMYEFLTENNYIQKDTIYYIASLDARPYIEGYRG